MKRIIAAFSNTLRGFQRALATEASVRQEMTLLGLGFALAPFLARSLFHGAVLLGALFLLLAIELLNTAIEKLADHVAPERHETVGYVKDLGSAAVFCSLCLSVLVWAAALVERVLG